MSVNKPEPKDRTALYIAIVGACATIAAALIGVLPTILNRAPAPTPVAIVITASPAPTSNTQATIVPTAQALPTALSSTSTSLPPSAVPTNTIVPPTDRPTPPPLPTQSSIVTFLLINNLPRTMEFFIDGKSATKINTGTYQSLQVPHGMHELKQCIVGTDYSNPNNCFATSYDVEPNPDVWEMFDKTNPLKTDANINLLLLNRANTPQDVYVDGKLAQNITPGKVIVITIIPAHHVVQSCAAGFSPPNGACGQPVGTDYSAPTGYFIINGESS